MTLRELGEFCKNRKIDCDHGCKYGHYCFDVLPEILEDMSPCELLTILDNEVNE